MCIHWWNTLWPDFVNVDSYDASLLAAVTSLCSFDEHRKWRNCGSEGAMLDQRRYTFQCKISSGGAIMAHVVFALCKRTSLILADQLTNVVTVFSSLHCLVGYSEDCHSFHANTVRLIVFLYNYMFIAIKLGSLALTLSHFLTLRRWNLLSCWSGFASSHLSPDMQWLRQPARSRNSVVLVV